MSTAERVAETVAAQWGRNPWTIAEAVGLTVHWVAMPGSHREMYAAESAPGGLRVVLLARDADHLEATELLAHALGHHFLHSGNRLARGRRIWNGSHEVDADRFAAALLVPADALERALSWWDTPTAWDLAQHFSVTEELIQLRVSARSEGVNGLPA